MFHMRNPCLCAFTNFRMLRKSHTAQQPYVFKWQIYLCWDYNLFLSSKLNTQLYKKTKNVKVTWTRNVNNHVFDNNSYKRVQNREKERCFDPILGPHQWKDNLTKTGKVIIYTWTAGNNGGRWRWVGNKAMEGDNDMLIVVTYAQCTSGMFCVWNILVNLLSSIAIHSQTTDGRDRWIRGLYTDDRGPSSQFIVWCSVRMCQASNAHLWR